MTKYTIKPSQGRPQSNAKTTPRLIIVEDDSLLVQTLAHEVDIARQFGNFDFKVRHVYPELMFSAAYLAGLNITAHDLVVADVMYATNIIDRSQIKVGYFDDEGVLHSRDSSIDGLLYSGGQVTDLAEFFGGCMIERGLDEDNGAYMSITGEQLLQYLRATKQKPANPLASVNTIIMATSLANVVGYNVKGQREGTISPEILATPEEVLAVYGYKKGVHPITGKNVSYSDGLIDLVKAIRRGTNEVSPLNKGSKLTSFTDWD